MDFFSGYLDLARQCALKYHRVCGMEFDDAQQVCLTALWQCSKSVDLSKSRGFPAYAWTAMKRRLFVEKTKSEACKRQSDKTALSFDFEYHEGSTLYDYLVVEPLPYVEDKLTCTALLSVLREDLQQIIVYHYYLDLSFAEIARLFACSKQAIQQKHSLAIQQMKRFYNRVSLYL